MNVCVTRLCNESPLLKGGGRHDSHTPNSRHQSSGGNHAQQGPSEEDEVELNKWQYVSHLASYLYQVSPRVATSTRSVCVMTLVALPIIKSSDVVPENIHFFLDD